MPSADLEKPDFVRLWPAGRCKSYKTSMM